MSARRKKSSVLPSTFSWEAILSSGRIVTRKSNIAFNLGVTEKAAEKIDNLLLPETVSDLSAIVKFAAQNRITLHTAEHIRLYPERVPADSGVVVSLSGMARKIAVNETSQTITVLGGATVNELKTHLGNMGLDLLHPLPALDAQLVVELLALGGSCGNDIYADGAGELAISTSGVLATGVAYGGLSTPRSAAGPDLDALPLGTGNTFAILTGAVLKLAKKQEHGAAGYYKFPSAQKALTGLAEFYQRGALSSDVLLVCPHKAQAALELSFGGLYEVALAVSEFAEKIFMAHGAKKFDAPEGKTEPILSAPRSAGLWTQVIGLSDWAKKNKTTIAVSAPSIEGAQVTLFEKNPDEETVKAFFEASIECNMRLLPSKWFYLLEKERAFSAYYGGSAELFKELKEKIDPSLVLNPNTRPYSL